MSRGRPRDPKRRQRATGHRRQSGDEAPAQLELVTDRPDVAMPEAPEDLPEEARAMWAVVVEDLVPRGLTPAMLFNVEALVVAMYRHRQARREIDRLGVLVQGQRGPMVNPLIRMERDEAVVFMRLASELGLTLAARIRLGLMQLAGLSMGQQLRATLDQE